MATPEPTRHRFTADDYHRMAEAGVLGEDHHRLELLEGEIIEMSPIGSPHAAIVNRLTRMLVGLVGERAIVQVQGPVRISDLSELQPDLALLRPRDDFYAGANPRADDVLLVIEVADTTVRWDRETKAPLYGKSGVVETWVVDLPDVEVHVFTEPRPAGYRTERHLFSGDSAVPVAFPDLTIAVADLLL